MSAAAVFGASLNTLKALHMSDVSRESIYLRLRYSLGVVPVYFIKNLEK